jgi:hypothetical protein
MQAVKAAVEVEVLVQEQLDLLLVVKQDNRVLLVEAI